MRYIRMAKSGSSSHNNERVMSNLEECVRSAGFMVSAATIIAISHSSYSGSLFGSELGEVLSEEQRDLVE